MSRSGKGILDRVITSAGGRWLEGLAPVYDRLVEYLGDDPTFGQDVPVAGPGHGPTLGPVATG
jgi:hypothetical protein